MLCKNCNREFTPNTPRQIYCDIRCTDAAAHKRARQRARLGRLNDAYKGEHLELQDTAHIDRLVQIHEQRMREEEAAAIEAVTGYKSKTPTIQVPDEPDKPMKLEDI